MIWAVTTACGLNQQDSVLLYHWIDYYRKMADRIVVMVAFEGVPSAALPFAGMENISYTTMSVHDAMGAGQHVRQIEYLRSAGMVDEDWLMIADLDEFYEFPDIPEGVAVLDGERSTRQAMDYAIKICESRGTPAIYGHFVDMVSADGSLSPVIAGKSLQDQFPVETRFTEMVMGGGTRKVMLMRPWVYVMPGHHNAYASVGGQELTLEIPYGDIGDYKVRHYKWKAGLIERLTWQARSMAPSSRWKKEACLTLEYLRKHGDRIDLNDPPGLTDMSKRFYGNPS